VKRFPEATRRALYVRAGNTCEMCGVVRRMGLHISHRIARGMGGAVNERWDDLSRYMLICGKCHAIVEGRPAAAARFGWKSPRYVDPSKTMCWTWRGWVFLTPGGGYTWPPLGAGAR
jgi:hypothetical protein